MCPVRNVTHLSGCTQFDAAALRDGINPPEKTPFALFALFALFAPLRRSKKCIQ
jgi:hypothetical protein